MKEGKEGAVSWEDQSGGCRRNRGYKYSGPWGGGGDGLERHQDG